MFDARYWSRVFRDRFAAQCARFVSVVEMRVLPAFDSLEREADEVASAEYERLGSYLGDPDLDMSTLAEQAAEAGMDYYQSMDAVRQSLLNVSAAALAHMVNQQLLTFLRREVLHPSREDDPSQISLSVLHKRLSEAGVDLRSLAAWNKLEELHLVASVVKHAEGPSAARLRKLRPEMFTHPELRRDGANTWAASVYMPLMGEDVYVTMDDLRAYSEAATRFWTEFGDALLSSKRN